MLKRLYLSPIFNSWLAQAITMVFAFIAVPIVLSKLLPPEINVWFLISTVVAIGQGVQFGFYTTFVRFLSYSAAGVSVEEFENLHRKFEVRFAGQVNESEFFDLMLVLKKVYIAISSIYFILMVTFGSWAMYKPISLMGHHSRDGWITWGLVIVTSTATLYFSVYQIYLMGVNEVSLSQRVTSLSSLAGLGVFLAVNSIAPTLFNIVAVYQLIAVANALWLMRLAFTIRNGFLKEGHGAKFKKHLFRLVWDSAWKNGVTTVISNIIRHASGIIVAQIVSPVASASFLLTKRLFDILDNLSMATFQAKSPEIASLRGKGDFLRLIPLIRKVYYLSYAVYLIGFSIIAFFGQEILTCIKGNVTIGGAKLIIFFSVAYFVNRWCGLNLAVSNQANRVIEHVTATIYAVVYFLFIFVFYSHLGLAVFPAAMTVGVLAISPIVIRKTYKTINTTFITFERNLSLPAFLLLIILNTVYYWSRS